MNTEGLEMDLSGFEMWSIAELDKLLAAPSNERARETWAALPVERREEMRTEWNMSVAQHDRVLGDIAAARVDPATAPVMRDQRGLDRPGNEWRSLSVVSRLVYVNALSEEHLDRFLTIKEMVSLQPTLLAHVNDERQLNEIWDLAAAKRDYNFLRSKRPNRHIIQESLRKTVASTQFVFNAAYLHFLLSLVGVTRLDIFKYEICGRELTFDACPLTGAIAGCNNPDMAAEALRALLNVDVTVEPSSWRSQQLATYLLHTFKFARLTTPNYKVAGSTGLMVNRNFYNQFSHNHSDYITRNLPTWLEKYEIPTTMSSKGFLYVYLLYMCQRVITTDRQHDWDPEGRVSGYMAIMSKSVLKQHMGPFNVYPNFSGYMAQVAQAKGPITSLRGVVEGCARRRNAHAGASQLNEAYKAVDHDAYGPVHKYVPDRQYYYDAFRRIGARPGKMHVIEDPDTPIHAMMKTTPVLWDTVPEMVYYHNGEHELIGHVKRKPAAPYPSAYDGQWVVDATYGDGGGHSKSHFESKVNNVLLRVPANVMLKLQLYPDQKLSITQTHVALPYGIEELLPKYEYVEILSHGKMHSPGFLLVCRNHVHGDVVPRTDKKALVLQFYAKLAMMAIGSAARNAAWDMGIIGGFGPKMINDELIRPAFWRELVAITRFVECARVIKINPSEAMQVSTATPEADMLSGLSGLTLDSIEGYEGQLGIETAREDLGLASIPLPVPMTDIGDPFAGDRRRSPNPRVGKRRRQRGRSEEDEEEEDGEKYD